MYLRKGVGRVTLVQDPAEERPTIDTLWSYDALRNNSYVFYLAEFLQGSTPKCALIMRESRSELLCQTVSVKMGARRV